MTSVWAEPEEGYVEDEYESEAEALERIRTAGRFVAPPTPAGHKPIWTFDRQEGQLTLSFHEGQARTWAAKRRFIAMIAGTQGGKTTFGPLWLWREIKDKGAGDYMVVTPTGPLAKLKAVPEFLRFFDEALHLGDYHKGDRVFEIPASKGLQLYGTYDSTRIIFGSAVAPESLESATAKGAWLDEVGQQQFRLESWDAVNRRVSLYQGRVLMTTTPYNLGWLKTNVYDPWVEGEPDVTVIQFASTLNPVFPRKEMARVARNMPAWKVALFYKGQFIKPDTLIYQCFEDRDERLGGHLCDDFLPPAHWPRFVGLDFGGANTALVWCAYNPERDQYVMYDESLEGSLPAKDHAARALAKVKEQGATVLYWIGGAKSEDQQRLDWAVAGVPVEPPMVFDLEPGIDRGLALIKMNKLRVQKHLRGIRSEFGTYSRDQDERGNALETIFHKARFHRLDAYRYLATKLVEPTVLAPPVLIVGGVSSAWTKGRVA